MPLYSFYCEKCDKVSEKLTYRPEWKDIRCGICAGEVKKLVDAPGLINVKGFNAENGYSKGVDK
jgi:putative FmdB family regulatory protein